MLWSLHLLPSCLFLPFTGMLFILLRGKEEGSLLCFSNIFLSLRFEVYCKDKSIKISFSGGFYCVWHHVCVHIKHCTTKLNITSCHFPLYPLHTACTHFFISLVHCSFHGLPQVFKFIHLQYRFARSPFHPSPSHLYMYFVFSPLTLIPFLKPPAFSLLHFSP